MNSFYASKLIGNCIWQDFTAHFKSETTQASYQTDIDEIMNHFQKDFLKICQEDIDAYFLWMQSRVENGFIQPATMAKKFRELHSFAEYICENREKYNIEKEFQDWYYIYLKQVTKQEKYAKSISVEHMDRLLEAAAEDEMAYTILVLLYRAGLSSSEIISLKRSDFAVYDNGTYVVTDKRKEPCYIPEDVFVILQHYMQKERDSGVLFVNRRGNPLNLMYISRMMKKYTAKAGIPSYSAESIRNTCGVNLFAYGAGAKQVAMQLGVTEMQIHRYKNLSYRDDLQRAANHLVKVQVLPPKGMK